MAIGSPLHVVHVLEHGVGVVHGQDPLQPHRGLDIVADILGLSNNSINVFERKQITHLV